MNQPSLIKLENGLKLVITPMTQVESVTVMVGVRAGSRDETRSISGLSHFLEHMAFKGTTKRPNTLIIASQVEGVGGEFNAFTDRELTGYWLKLASKHQQLGFDILGDMLSNSLLKAEEIEREKGVIIEEINMYEDMPQRRVIENFIRLLYGDNSMGWDIAGDQKSVQGIKRADFVAYLKRLYYPGNMVLGVAGKVEVEKVKKLAGRYFGQLQNKGQKVTKPIKIKQEKSQVDLSYKKTEQAHFCLGVPGYRLSHPDRFGLGVLSAVLGGGMSSRLFMEIRERRGLAYYVGAMPEFHTDSGFLLARAGVKLSQLEEAIKIILEQLNLLKEKLVGNKELKKAKEMLKGQLILSLEDSHSQAQRYLTQLLLEGKTRTPEQSLALIDQVTATQVRKIARDIFKVNKLNLALVGPFKDKTRFNKLLLG